MKSDKTFGEIINALELYAQLKRELGAAGVQRLVTDAKRSLEAVIRDLRALPDDAALRENEPDDLLTIRRSRPIGPHELEAVVADDAYRDRLAGAFLGRCAGCILGAPVEGWSVKRMEEWASTIGDRFPCVDYWSEVPNGSAIRYLTTRADAYTAGRINGVPVDDDLTYTVLGLLILEEYGPEFTVADVGRAWLKHLPFACTAEDVALANLEIGVPATEAASTGGRWAIERAIHMGNPSFRIDGPIDNPYLQWIGADIRADPWGYVAPGRPQLAAEMAYRDAYLSHRRNGIYGEMYFAAVIAAAFAVDDPSDALRIGLAEIPEKCTLANELRWALDVAPEVRSYRDAHDAVAERFPTMSTAHTVNNACLTVWGVTIGGTDFTRVIGETVAMGYDNDCTAATAGSIVGAVVGRSGVPEHWLRPFGNTFHTYLNGMPQAPIDQILDRFARAKERVVGGPT